LRSSVPIRLDARGQQRCLWVMAPADSIPPSRFIVDRERIIGYSEAAVYHTVRPEPEDDTAALQGLQPGFSGLTFSMS